MEVMSDATTVRPKLTFALNRFLMATRTVTAEVCGAALTPRSGCMVIVGSTVDFTEDLEVTSRSFQCAPVGADAGRMELTLALDTAGTEPGA